jgi:squalene cyclase
VSCHGGNVTVTAVAAARRKGIRVEESAQAEYVRATRLQYAAFADLMLGRTDSPTPLIESNALFALAQEGVPADRTIDALVNSLAARQLPGGYWIYRSVMRPPTSDSLFSTTAFAIRALREYAPPARKAEFDERIARAVRALESAEPATTEDHVMLLLGLKWAGADSAKIGKAAKAVAGLQREDGGWAQTPRLSSDAYATGTALHALFESGMAADSPAYRKGVAFLLRTQAADGSWYVASRAPKFQPYFEGGFPYGHDQWISQWGTGWAAIALSHALPDLRAAVDRR